MAPAARPSVPAGTAKPVSGDDATRPAAMDEPTDKDNLRLLSGIGPKIEGILHSIGVYKFEQIAGWTESERAWVDGFLKFKGRIERENWIGQADALARGGVEEYERVFGKKPR